MQWEARFVNTARRAGATAPGATLAAVAAELVARWSEPHRHYHDLAHLASCLDADGVEGSPAAALAAWGHDAIYDPRSQANEERSAQLLGSLLTRCGVPGATVARAMALVRMTAGHRVSDDPDAAILADADLAVLARPWPDYLSYVEAVRKEYAHVPEPLWQAGRSAVLMSLLDLPTLFHRHPERESPARTNLTRELRALTSG
ncbi:HD domain-containing protein [Allorhizocola rhizosphaerae]|uniref:HD domain-containing protein n=1 Tax=Allorhizocola rhizosphaerae TaxID=1872709 RepID=UPI000E3DDF24|nr:metal-dependent phosphohydrolase [Allorhizocola rhizosphaerae]